MVSNQDKMLAAAVKRLNALRLRDCFNPDDHESRPSEKQLEILKDTTTFQRFVVAANRSGKSQIGSREVAWWFEENHPYMQRPEKWGKGPLLILVIGRVGKQVNEELWENKIKRYLTPGTYKEVKQGNELQKVVNIHNGNRIVFMTHHNVEEARQKAQGFTAQYVWLDEMPNSSSFLTELMLRALVNDGRFLATFTPLIRNEEIMRIVENAEAPVAKRYKLAMLDNPALKGEEEKILAAHAHIPEAERRARLFGDWYVGDTAVYPFDAMRHYVIPEGYSPLAWPHIESIDPAASGKVGLIIAAWSPHDGRWYIVKDEYIEGSAPSELVEKVFKSTRGHNIIRRVCDPHEAWYIKEAALATPTRPSLHYMGVYKKNERKKELITKLQGALAATTVVLAPTCTRLGNELAHCQWSETVEDKIVNSSRWHLADATQYFLDNIPPNMVVEGPKKTFDQEMREANTKRKEKEAQEKSIIQRSIVNRRKLWSLNRR